MSQNKDVLVVGSGPVSMLCALGLVQQGCSAMLVTPQPLRTSRSERLFALNNPACALLRELGVWEHLSSPTRVARMEICAPDSTQLQISAATAGLASLCHTVEEQDLLVALDTMVKAAGIKTLTPARIDSLRTTATHAKLGCDGEEIGGRLIIGAEGVNSTIAQLADLASPVAELPFHAVVARLRLPRLGARALQWMSKTSGVLAFLPGAQQRACVIWSQRRESAQALQAQDDADFLAELERQTGAVVKDAAELSPRHGFPLREGVRPSSGHRVALVGDAAHSFHPLAGQGLAVGLGDIACLLSLATATDLGSRRMLGRYRRQRYLRMHATRALTSGLARLADGSMGEASLNCGLRVPLGNLLAQFANSP